MSGNQVAFEAAVKKAQSYAWEERWMKAIEQYEAAIAEFPDDVSVRSGLAFAYYRGERLKEALREYRRVRDASPEDPVARTKIAQILGDLGRSADAAEAWMDLADLYARQKAAKRAMAAYREAVRSQPTNKEARERLAAALDRERETAEASGEYLALARLWHDEGDEKRTATCCRRALSLDGRNKGARALLERLTSGNGAVDDAPPLLRNREELGPVDEAVKTALGALAEALLADGDLMGAPEPSSPPEVDEAAADTRSHVGAVLGKAVDFHSRGMIEEALGCYEDLLHKGVARPEVVFSLGVLNKELSHFDEAAKHLKRTKEVPAYSLASYLSLGECYWAQGRAGEALDSFLQGLKIIDLSIAGEDRTADLEEAYRDLAAGGWRGGDGRGSELLVHSLLDLLTGSDWRRKVQDARRKLESLAENGVVPILPEVLDIPGGDEVVDRMVRSREYLRAGMPLTALEESYRAIRLAPTYLPVHMGLAEVFAQQGKAEEAVGKYAAVAAAHLMRGEPRRAMEVYRKALAAAPMTIPIRERLIDLLEAQGELDLALDEYIALGESYYRLARVDVALEKFEQALKLADQTKAPTAWRVGVLHRVADLQMQRVSWKEATATYERILRLSPDDEQAGFRLVELRYRLGQEAMALRDLDALIVIYGKRQELRGIVSAMKELVASYPQDVSLRSRLSRIYVELGMKKEAIAELDTLGELQLEAGRRREAMETLRTIISLGPDEQDGYTQLLRQLGETRQTGK
jgi:tetratricopeptide (TPR) repeat protein